MDSFKISLNTTVNKARGNTSGSIMDRFFKPRSSAMLGHLVYSLDGPGAPMTVSGTHEGFFNSAFGIWIGGKHVSDGFCRPIRMHEVSRVSVIRHQRVEQLSILRQEVDIRRTQVVPGKHGMTALMLALKEAEIKAEAIPVHMHQGHT